MTETTKQLIVLACRQDATVAPAQLKAALDVLEGRTPPAEKRSAEPRDLATVTHPEAARRMHVSASTVRRLVKDGQLDVLNVRGKNRVTVASLERYFDGRAVA